MLRCDESFRPHRSFSSAGGSAVRVQSVLCGVTGQTGPSLRCRHNYEKGGLTVAHGAHEGGERPGGGGRPSLELHHKVRPLSLQAQSHAAATRIARKAM